MAQFNFLVLAVAAFIPLITGFVWYHPKVFGTTWQRVSDTSDEKIKNSNMVLIMGLTYFLGFMLAMALCSIVIHQFAIGSILANTAGVNDPNSVVGMWVKDFFNKYGNNFRTFKHGVLHGVISGFFIALPMVTINALFERKSFKYVAIHCGYWIITLALMGGTICQFN